MTPEEKRERRRESSRRYRAANPERVREAARKRRAANPERAREYQLRYRAANLERVRAQGRERMRKNPRNKEQRRATRIRSAHGMTSADWSALWESQLGRCYLCGELLNLEAKRGVHIDHDHSCCPADNSCSACRRGLACNNCNVLIGFARDDPARLRLIADNLESALYATRERLAAKPVQDELSAVIRSL